MITATVSIDKVRMRLYNVVGLLTNEIDLSILTGAQRRLTVADTVELSAFGGLEFPRPIAVQLEIDRAGSTLMITGTADVHIAGECNRCLGTFELRRVIDVDESFTIGSNADPFDDGNVVRDEQLDLTDLIRQVVDAALPLVKLCKDDCAGLCSACGSDLNEGTCECGLPTKGDHG